MRVLLHVGRSAYEQSGPDAVLKGGAQLKLEAYMSVFDCSYCHPPV